MRRILLALATTTVGVAIACATSNNNPFNDPGDGGADGSLPDGQQFNGDSSQNEGQACATGTFEAKQAPAAMLVLLQRSGTMAQNNKYAFAAQAIVQALDQNVFDNMTLGLLAAPSAMTVPGPQCFPLPVGCGVSPFPNVDLVNSLQLKSSDATGVRHSIKTYLNTNGPDMSAGDGNPLYDAINLGIGALKGWNGKGKRILFVVTDGGISCTSLSNTRSKNAFMDGNGCPDWENPNAIMGIVKTANADPSTPIDTFIVGVPGSDTYDPTGMAFPPYHMRAALSDIAHAGSPNNVPMGCTWKDPFHPTSSSDSVVDPDPTTSCHFDMTQNNYSAQAVADAISSIRGKVLGCIFDLPVPDGGTIDPTRVNVDYSTGNGPDIGLYKRKDMTNNCATDGCWDYTADGKVELIGKACDDLKANGNSKVNISVGCQTIVK